MAVRPISTNSASAAAARGDSEPRRDSLESANYRRRKTGHPAAKREGIPLNRLSPSFVIKHLTSLGLIVKSDYETLKRAMHLRNTVVHGFKPSKLSSRDIESLLTVIDKLSVT